MATPDTNGALPAGQQVEQPRFVPLSFLVRTIDGTPTNFVSLEIFGPTGHAVYLLEPDSARHVAKMLTTEHQRARTKLTLPPGGIITP